MEYYQLPTAFCNIILALLDDLKAQFITAWGTMEPMNLSRGVRQGDGLSLTLFIMFLNPLLRWLDRIETGYTLNNGHKINSLAFCDDLSAVCTSRDKCQQYLSDVHEFCKYNNLQISLKKSACTTLRKRLGIDIKGNHLCTTRNAVQTIP